MYLVWCLNVAVFIGFFLWFPGHVNVAPRHLTAEAETLLLATLIHEVYIKESFPYDNLVCIVKHWTFHVEISQK